jgi:2-methylcitrate dehydratase PrpD
MEIPLTRHLASFCHNLRYDNLPAAVVDRTKYFLLDYLGVAVRGSLSDSSQPVYRLVGDLGGVGTATVLGCKEKATYAYAALANGVSAHSIELDDTSWRVDIFDGAGSRRAGWCQRQGFYRCRCRRI